ncbi:MAG: hypothetical protein HYU97_05390 [Deltaproteobacteria bacterium]|nr:hypothetical protein [Deltaproteobacteria bacterium]
MFDQLEIQYVQLSEGFQSLEVFHKNSATGTLMIQSYLDEDGDGVIDSYREEKDGWVLTKLSGNQAKMKTLEFDRYYFIFNSSTSHKLSPGT